MNLDGRGMRGLGDKLRRGVRGGALNADSRGILEVDSWSLFPEGGCSRDPTLLPNGKGIDGVDRVQNEFKSSLKSVKNKFRTKLDYVWTTFRPLLE